MDVQEDIARLLALQIRLQFDTQADAIVALSNAGFATPRIASLLGASPDTVKSAVKRASARKSKQAPKRAS